MTTNILSAASKMLKDVPEDSDEHAAACINTALVQDRVEEDVEEDVDAEAGIDDRQESRRWSQYLAATTATMAALAGGTALAWTSPALPLLQRTNSSFTLTDDEASWVGALLPLGAVFGAPPAGFLAQRLGRKTAVLSLSGPFILSWLLVLTTRSALWLYAARWLAGLAVGGVCVACPIYVAEVVEDAIRGTCGALLQVMFNGGMLFSYTVGLSEDYMTLAWACAVVPVLFLVLFVWMPETPATLLDRGGDGEVAAARSLRWLRRWSSARNAALELEMAALRRAQALAKGGDGSADGKGLAGLTARMRRPVARKALGIALGLVAAQQMSGVCVVVFYTESIFRSAGSSLSPGAAAVSVGIVLWVMAFVTTLVVDRTGRRVLLIGSATFMGLSLVSLAAFFQLQASLDHVDMGPFAWIPVLAILAFIIAYCIGLGPLPWTVMAEVLPADIRGPAGSVVSSFCWLLSFAVTKSFQNLVDYFGVHSSFWLFSGCCGLTLVFVILAVPETKGKSLRQIQIELGGQ